MTVVARAAKRPSERLRDIGQGLLPTVEVAIVVARHSAGGTSALALAVSLWQRTVHCQLLGWQGSHLKL